jgi:hypothetical protein
LLDLDFLGTKSSETTDQSLMVSYNTLNYSCFDPTYIGPKYSFGIESPSKKTVVSCNPMTEVN